MQINIDYETWFRESSGELWQKSKSVINFSVVLKLDRIVFHWVSKLLTWQPPSWKKEKRKKKRWVKGGRKMRNEEGKEN